MLARLAAFALLLLPAVAVADPADAPAITAHATDEHRLALAVNQPFGWSDGNIGVSAYAGVAPHVAVRANVAKYDYALSDAQQLAIIALSGGEDEAERSGGFLDVGLSGVYYPRRLWSGLMVEVGALRRAEKTHMADEFASPAVVDRDVTMYAGRALLGWSWLIYDRAFIAVAVGGSLGHASGSEATKQNDTDQMTVVRPVSGMAGSPEGYLRFGVAF